MGHREDSLVQQKSKLKIICQENYFVDDICKIFGNRQMNLNKYHKQEQR